MKKLALVYFSFFLSTTAIAANPYPQVVENSVYPSGKPFVNAPSSAMLSELYQNIKTMRQEIQQLRGALEEQGYNLDKINHSQQAMSKDVEARLQRLEMVNVLSTKGRDATTELTPIKATPLPVVKPALEAPPKLTAPTLNEKEAYTKAYDALRNGHYQQAVSAFKYVIANFPQGEFADNSMYWLAETYNIAQDTNAARSTFEMLMVDYPNSPKVPDATLKLAYIELDNHNKERAKNLLTRVTQNYPDSKAADLAAKKLATLDEIRY